MGRAADGVRRLRRHAKGSLVVLVCFLLAAGLLLFKSSLAVSAPTSSMKIRSIPVMEAGEGIRLPKVALLFLTKDDLPHASTWSSWLDAAQASIPARRAAIECQRGPPGLQTLQQTCHALSMTAGAGQLFSVYVHAPPAVSGYDSSFWTESLLPIEKRIETRWGDYSLVEATRILLTEAFKDPWNQRFVLLSESDIPLYDAKTFYTQLMVEQKSRINACAGGMELMPYRWTDRMKTPHLDRIHWRKSSQWFSLIRKHVQTVVEDEEVSESFKKYCHYERSPDGKRLRDCVSDEHYIPTLLAVHGLEEEAACEGWGIASMDWSRGGPHPRSFQEDEISVQLITELRDVDPEEARKAYFNASDQFLSCHQIPSIEEWCHTTRADEPPSFRSYNPIVLSAPKKLVARKFPGSSADAVHQLFEQDCEQGPCLMGRRQHLKTGKNGAATERMPSMGD